MKTYFKKLKSGNYEIATVKDHTHSFNGKKRTESFFNNLFHEYSNVYDRRNCEYKKSKIVKTRYSQSQTYFESFDELWNSLK